MFVVAHRGASGHAPENTIPSFELAWELGADAIEGDFRLTLDGHLVCIHDATTERVTDSRLIVKESTLSELQTLDVGLKYGEKFKGTKIPTLKDVLLTIPENKHFFIEIKCGKDIIPELLEVLRGSDIRNEQIVFICFNQHVLQKLKSEAPEYKYCWLCSFRKDQDGKTIPSITTVLETLKYIKADALNSDSAIPETYIRRVIEKGYEWNVWTVDDPETAYRMKALGASSITTNLPKEIRKPKIEF